MTEREELILLAERVMGWKPIHGAGGRRYRAKLNDGRHVWMVLWDEAPSALQHEGWNPKRSWDDAGMLVDALRAKGSTFTMGGLCDVFAVAFAGPKGRPGVSDRGNTGPEAIYRAELAWAQRDAAEVKQ